MAHQRYQAAIEAYKKAPPNNAVVWNKMGIAYQLMFNLTDAMHCYRTSRKLNPKNSNVLNNLGTVYDALKEYRNAEKMYRKALKIDPQFRPHPQESRHQPAGPTQVRKRLGRVQGRAQDRSADLR